MAIATAEVRPQHQQESDHSTGNTQPRHLGSALDEVHKERMSVKRSSEPATNGNEALRAELLKGGHLLCDDVMKQVNRIPGLTPSDRDAAQRNEARAEKEFDGAINRLSPKELGQVSELADAVKNNKMDELSNMFATTDPDRMRDVGAGLQADLRALDVSAKVVVAPDGRAVEITKGGKENYYAPNAKGNWEHYVADTDLMP